jgi:DNA-binding phage protein
MEIDWPAPSSFGLQSVQGAVLLGERGLVIEARTLVRAAIEALFYVGASIRDSGFAEDLGREHVHRMDKLAKAHARLAALRGPEDIEVGKQLIEDARDKERQGRRLPLPDVAAKAGMTSTYEGLYRVLSSDAHSNIMSIYSTWSSNAKEPTISWGPDRDLNVLGDTLLLAAFVGLLLVDELNSRIDDKHIEAESHRLSRLYLEVRGRLAS